MVPDKELTKRQFNEIIRNEVKERPHWELNGAFKCYTELAGARRMIELAKIELALSDLWRKSNVTSGK